MVLHGSCSGAHCDLVARLNIDNDDSSWWPDTLRLHTSNSSSIPTTAAVTQMLAAVVTYVASFNPNFG